MSHLPIQERKLSYSSVWLRIQSFFNFRSAYSAASASALASALALTSAFSLNAQKVGLNTDTPLAGLHVISDDGLLIQSEYGVGVLPITGYGTRMLFNSKTGAFRTGRINDDDGGIYQDWWDFLSIGDYSFVAGINSKASGYASIAFGDKNQALGLSSFAAAGRSNMASGNFSFVTGFGNVAYSYLEFVLGEWPTVYTPASTSGFVESDRLFVIGNGLNESDRHNAMTVLKNGNIGISTDDPQSTLDVGGTATIQKAIISDSLQSVNLQLSNGATNGYLLQSDAIGNAQWTSPSSVFSDDWSATGNDIYNNNAGNIGIGTNTPNAKLHVVGNMTLDAGHLSFQNSGQSVFIGDEAGAGDDLSNNNSVFIGHQAGKANTDGTDNIAIGTNALSLATSSNYNIGMGENVMGSSTMSGNYNIGIGNFSLENLMGGSDNFAAGQNAFGQGTSGFDNVILGNYAADAVTTGFGNVVIGKEAMGESTTGNSNTIVGNNAGHEVTGGNNTMVGAGAGSESAGSGNVFLGYSAGYSETGNDKLYIDNSSTVSPLLYGDFSRKHLTVNDSLTSKYFQMSDGSGMDKILRSDAEGHGTWVSPAVLSPYWVTEGTSIYNQNSDFVGIGTNLPETKLHVVGSLTLDGGRIRMANTGQSVFVGNGAGENDDLVDNKNVFIGDNAGYHNTNGTNNVSLGNNSGASNTLGFNNTAIGSSSLENNTISFDNTAIGKSALSGNTIGNGNTAVGSYAFESNQTGQFNTVVGYYTMHDNNGTGNIAMGNEAGRYNGSGNFNTFLGQSAGRNNTGSGNVMIGNLAGVNEAGNDKLYISNSASSSPLVYGDFSTNKVTINDSLATKHFVATQSAQVNGSLKIIGGKIAFNNTGQSVFIGEEAGEADDLTDNNSVFIGHHAGKANTNGSDNIAIGAFALDEANSNYNIAMGENVLGSSGLSGGFNTGIGNFSLANVASGENNIAIGQNAGGSMNSASRNIAIGNYAQDAITSGSFNTTIGYEALGQNVSGESNTTIGHYAGHNITGDKNVMVGSNAGLSVTGSSNVMLGNDAGFNETGSDKLYIDNSGSNTPLIYGDFATNEVTINDSLTVGKELSVGTSIANSTLEVNGSVAAKFKTPLVAGTTNPDGTGMVWRYNSGTGDITLPGPGTCANRMYVIINQTGTTRNISTYRDLVTNTQTTIASSVALWIMSDGIQWWQIK